MSFTISDTLLSRLSMTAVSLSGLAGLASAQFDFSIDWHSVTVGVPDSFTGTPITEGDILTPVTGIPALGPLPTPGITISAGPGGLGLPGWAACVGHPGGTPGLVEVDAFSYGKDYPMNDGSIAPGYPGDYLFSTDEFARGYIGPPFPPDLTTESPVVDHPADCWRNVMPMPPGPLPPMAFLAGHTGIVDGDGLPSGSGFAYPGTGLIEPDVMGFPNIGDNLDAVNWIDPNGGAPWPVYFSLDDGIFDPLSGVPGTNSAATMGVTGADIMVTNFPGGPPVLWAWANQLGLNLTGGPDDLDALAIWENGTGFFEPSKMPYDWLTGQTDMVLFSVRRGSAVIGMPDSIFGIPIEEGDILTTPMVNGLSPFPGIFCAAENIALATNRTMGVTYADDLDALDTLFEPIFDCNGNGMEDAIDIALGASTDGNMNGIPDECEFLVTPYCFCGSGAPCSNTDPNAGCANSTGQGALMGASGSTSVAADDLILTVSQLPPNQFAFMFKANNAIGPFVFGDGFRCAGGALVRFGVQNSGATGTISKGPGLAATYGIAPYSTYRFHCWYRDPLGPCGSGFNTPNAISVTFLP
jgi:hypothetical protein